MYRKWLLPLAASFSMCFLVGCASNPNTPSKYDPSTSARLRLYFDSAYPIVIFNHKCYPIGYEPDLDVLDTQYRWDFAPNKTKGIPATRPGRYDEFFVKAGVPMTIRAASSNFDDAVYLTLEPGKDYEVFLDDNMLLTVRQIRANNGKVAADLLKVQSAKACPRWKHERKFAD